MEFIRENFYILVSAFTGFYALAFIAVLGDRMHVSKPTRRFTLFLSAVYLWSVRDAVISVLSGTFSSEALLPVLVAVSPVYLILPLFGFGFLIAVYNSVAPRELEFRSENLVFGTLGGIAVVIYLAALIWPSVLYRSLSVNALDYAYIPGPGLRLLSVAILVSALVPCGALLAFSRSRPRSEAVLITAGVFTTLMVVLPSSLQPIAPLRNLPRLGCLSMVLVACSSAIALLRFEPLSSAKRALREKNAWRDVGQSLKTLADSDNEAEVFQNICDYSNRVSESILMAIVTFSSSPDQYKVRAVSDNSKKRHVLTDILPLMPGQTYPVEKSEGFRRVLKEGNAQVCRKLGEAFYTTQGIVTEAKLQERFGIRQVFILPIVCDSTTRGAILLLRSRVAENAAMFEVFSVQCSLVMRFSEHVRQLEHGKRLEEQLRQSQKMEAIGLLAGGIAHDFNNLLAGISGFAGLLKRKHCSKDSSLRKYVDPIVDAAARGSELTGQLLAFARKGNYQQVPVDLHKMVDSARGILERTIDKRIQIETKFEAEVPMVLGDPSQLENVALNMGLNARDAMPEGGRLVFRTTNQRFTESVEHGGKYRIKAGAYIVLEVIDTGVGMDPDTKERIFEPFFTTKKTGKGTGLGLAGAYGCIKNHGGYIEVDSNKGRGTSVRVLLPTTCEQSADDSCTDADEIVNGKGHVMVIDDEKIVRDVSREILEDLGYAVTICSDGVQALDFYEKHHQKVDLVIVDMIMPRMAGYDCYKGLRKIKPDVKVVIATGYSLPEETQGLIARGVSGFIQKPFEAEALSKVVADAIQNSSALHASA